MSSSTQHNLTPSTRAHLIKSSKKLAHLLGTTPTLALEDQETASLHSSRSFSSLKHSGSSSSRAPSPAPVFISIPAGDKTRRRSGTIDMPSPVSPNPIDEETALKRKKLAKITRTLGENVPPELVFGMPPSRYGNNPVSITEVQVDRKKPTARRRGASISHLVFARNIESSRSSIIVPRTRDAPFHSPVGLSHVPVHRSSFDSDVTSPSEDEGVSYGERSRTRREERGWAGEWNRMSMAEVRTKLRALKA